MTKPQFHVGDRVLHRRWPENPGTVVKINSYQDSYLVAFDVSLFGMHTANGYLSQSNGWWSQSANLMLIETSDPVEVDITSLI